MKSSVVSMVGLSVLSLVSTAHGQWGLRHHHRSVHPPCAPVAAVTTAISAPTALFPALPPEPVIHSVPLQVAGESLPGHVGALNLPATQVIEMPAPRLIAAVNDSVRLDTEDRSAEGLSLEGSGKGTVIVVTGDNNVISGFGTLPLAGGAAPANSDGEQEPSRTSRTSTDLTGPAAPALNAAQQEVQLLAVRAENEALKAHSAKLQAELAELRQAVEAAPAQNLP